MRVAERTVRANGGRFQSLYSTRVYTIFSIESG
jgi:hypothetical protein